MHLKCYLRKYLYKRGRNKKVFEFSDELMKRRMLEMGGSKSRNKTFGLLTLGCAKNNVESDFIRGSLEELGYEYSDLEGAQVIIVLTCAFTESAKEESIETILELGQCKREGRCETLIVTGCLAQRYCESLYKEIPEADGIIGLSHINDIGKYLSDILEGERISKAGQMPRSYQEKRSRSHATGPSAYLQISDGCDNRCTYCAIPLIRGQYRNRSIESLVTEAEHLVGQGVKEIVLIGQDIAAYGMEYKAQPHLEILLDELEQLDKLEWIRILYCQPKSIMDELIEKVAGSSKICPYFDIPFQHASKGILKKMGRKGDGEEYLKLIDKVRALIPDAAIRTSFIIGFPGETEEDFEELIRFIECVDLDYIGLFEYSAEEGTKAYEFLGRVAREVIRDRMRAVADIRDNLAIKKGNASIGRKVQVLVENIEGNNNEMENTCYQGRTKYQAPEVDGEIMVINAGDGLKVGDIVEAKITNANGYDLEGELEC